MDSISKGASHPHVPIIRHHPHVPRYPPAAHAHGSHTAAHNHLAHGHRIGMLHAHVALHPLHCVRVVLRRDGSAVMSVTEGVAGGTCIRIRRVLLLLLVVMVWAGRACVDAVLVLWRAHGVVAWFEIDGLRLWLGLALGGVGFMITSLFLKLEQRGWVVVKV
jgi:hypothetical protein